MPAQAVVIEFPAGHDPYALTIVNGQVTVDTNGHTESDASDEERRTAHMPEIIPKGWSCPR
jgi:hypothetical protein